MYEELYLRNEGYVSGELQSRIRATRVLIAGCGIGSTIAEAALRLGFEYLTLADGDTVELHNLNRQAYEGADAGKLKAEALAARLLRINPEARITTHADWITEDNVSKLVAGADLVFDTIDFLDLKTICDLHDEAYRQKTPIISAVSAGWGAAAVYFPATGSGSCLFRKLFGLPATGSVENASYVEHFTHFIDRIRTDLDPQVADAMAKALTVMEDGTPCPAPHVSVGSFAVASLAVTMAARLLNCEKVLPAPYMISANMGKLCAEGGIDLTPEGDSPQKGTEQAAR